MDADSASCKDVSFSYLMASQLIGGSATLQWTSFVRGYHDYCREWTATVEEVLSLKQESENCHDNFDVAVIKNDRVVGHVPKTVSRAVYFFLNRDGHSGFCEVTARPTNRGVDLGVEVPCVYRFYGRQSYIDRLSQLLQ